MLSFGSWVGLIWAFCFPIGFPSSFLFTFLSFLGFGSLFLGVILSRVWGGLSFGPFSCGPQLLDGVGLDVPLFCYIDPLPYIDCCHEIYFVVCNVLIDSFTNKQTNAILPVPLAPCAGPAGLSCWFVSVPAVCECWWGAGCPSPRSLVPGAR